MINPFSKLFNSKSENNVNSSQETKIIGAHEVKSGYSALIPVYSILDGAGYTELWAQQALMYYRICAPLFTAVDWIADEIQHIKPVLFDTKKKEVVTEHPVYDLLNSPFADTTYEEFIKEYTTFLIVTGNNYTLLRGNVKREPLEMV